MLSLPTGLKMLARKQLRWTAFLTLATYRKNFLSRVRHTSVSPSQQRSQFQSPVMLAVRSNQVELILKHSSTNAGLNQATYFNEFTVKPVMVKMFIWHKF